jgi:anti-anti-sigma factor
MELTIKQEDGYVVASTRGPIDVSSDQVFRDELHPIVREPGTKLILNVLGSNFLSSAGISSIVLLFTDANTCGSRVIIANPSAFITNVLNVTKLDSFLTTAASIEEAIKLLREDDV